MSNEVSTGQYLIVLGFAILVALLFPLSMVWAINTLFSLDIEYGFKEWLAAVILYQMFGTKFVPDSLKQNKSEGLKN